MAARRPFYVFVAFGFVLHFLCTLANNENPPNFVYRADFREPSNIFRHGFQNLGDNENLVDHVIGESCRSGKKKNSAFVATSLEEDVATEIGIDLLWTTPDAGPYIYVYKIRATGFFFDVTESLRKAFKETGKKHFLTLVETFSEEQEWVAYHGVPRELIFSASTYKKGSKIGTAEVVLREDNDFYVSENTRGNRDVFPINRPANTVTLIASNSPNPVSACFASCSTTNSARFGSGGNCKVGQIVYETSLSNEKGSFWDPIEKKHTEGLLPWKEVTTARGGHTIERPEDCTVHTGHPNDVSQFLTIECPKNRFYERFRVYLRGGIGSRTLFYTIHKEGVAGRKWKKSARQILLLRGGNLEDEGSTMNDVFADRYGIWWSEIHIYPLYPIIKI